MANHKKPARLKKTVRLPVLVSPAEAEMINQYFNSHSSEYTTVSAMIRRFILTGMGQLKPKYLESGTTETSQQASDHNDYAVKLKNIDIL